MHPLSAAVLLDVWERGQPLPPARQAILLLAAACPEEAPEDLLRLPVGRRDDRLLTLRALTFGETLAGSVRCPHCGELLEFAMPADAVRSAAPDTAPDESVVVEEGDYRVRLRLPTTDDLLVLLASDAATGEDLLRRCLVDARLADVSVEPEQLPLSLVAASAEALEAADPQAHVTLALACAACAHRWVSPFDIVSFFWTEIDRWAQRTLRDVHSLASAYGWGESDILALSAWRRASYLSLIHG
jgi:hypothetical protein